MLPSLLLALQALATTDVCLKQYGLRFLSHIDYSYCGEHAGRTCCSSIDIHQMRQKISEVRHAASPKLSHECYQMTSTAICSYCDADIGTGQAKHMCDSFCHRWFQACAQDYIDPYLDSADSMPFCTEDSMVCSRLSEAALDHEKFCELMGKRMLKIGHDNSDEICFNGESRQIKLFGAIKVQTSQTSVLSDPTGFIDIDLIREMVREFKKEAKKTIRKYIRMLPYGEKIAAFVLRFLDHLPTIIAIHALLWLAYIAWKMISSNMPENKELRYRQ